MPIAELGRRSVARLLLLAGLFGASAGCSAMRSMEQWKCDNMGMCHFGIKPSAPATALPPPPPAYGMPMDGACEPPCY